MVEIMLGNEDEEGEDEEAGEVEQNAPKAAPQALAAPDCPICYELMSPPTRIFQCGAGHLVCGTCRPRLQVFRHLYSGAVNFQVLNCISSGMPKQMWSGNEHFVGKIWTSNYTIS